MALVLILFAVASVSRVAGSFTINRDSASTSNHGSHVPTTGTRLTMYMGFDLNSCSDTDPNVPAGATTWPANSAFFVRHGFEFFIQPPETNQTFAAFMRHTTDFELYIDHVQTNAVPDFYSPFPQATVKLFVSNFANGMTGTHLFQGWWFVDGYLNGGAPNTQSLVLACNLQITFQ